MFKSFFGRFGRDMGIDLGTANTLVYIKEKGIILQEPSVVAIQRDTGSLLAVGAEAQAMIGRTPGSIIAIRPMRDGVIADFDTTEKMLRYFIEKAVKRIGLFHPRILIGVPSGVTEVEKRAVIDAGQQAGAREVLLIEEPMAAAIGAGLPVNEATGSLIVDIGGGTTEVAVISLSGIVVSQSARVAGDEMTESITQYVKRHYNLMIGERTSEHVKRTIGSAYPTGVEDKMEVRGRDLLTGLPKTIELNSHEVLKALSEPLARVVEAVRMTLDHTPPELSADILDRGIVLAGGGSLLKGMEELLHEETGMPVKRAEYPLTCVVRGTGIALNDPDMLQRVISTPRKYV